MKNKINKNFLVSFFLLILTIFFLIINFHFSVDTPTNFGVFSTPKYPTRETLQPAEISQVDKSFGIATSFDNKNSNSLLPLLSLPISLIAVVISFVNLWNTHYSKFTPLVTCGRLVSFASQLSAEEETWLIISFDLPISITNNSNARAGQVIGLRLVLSFPDSKYKDWKEYISPVFEINPKQSETHRKFRFNWLNEVVIGYWAPITILPKQSVYKHFLFEKRWNKPIVQNKVNCDLEVLVKGETKWKKVESWNGRLRKIEWLFMLGNYTSTTWRCVSTPYEFYGAIMPKEIEEDLTLDFDIHKVEMSPGGHLDLPQE